MKQFDNPAHLIADQYRTPANLNARIELHRRFSTNRYGWTRWVFDHLDPAPDQDVLELGCGPATLWRENAGRIPPGWRITLTDLSPGMIEDARANLADQARRFEFRPADAQAIPFEDASFDMVIANHMLYHVPDRARALAEIRRVLRPGGRLYAATNGFAHLGELNEWYPRFGLDAFITLNDAIAERFGLETGEALLRPWFGSVTLDRYPDGLEVTEVEPLLAFARSVIPHDQLAATQPHLERLADFFREEIAQHGAVRITKSSGIFTASSE